MGKLFVRGRELGETFSAWAWGNFSRMGVEKLFERGRGKTF